MEALRRFLIVLAAGWFVLGSMVFIFLAVEGVEISISLPSIAFAVVIIGGTSIGLWWIAQGLQK